ncbi:hypothetical protein BDV09DRAFT_188297 [Aspergillus tetrazonus]
MEGKDENLWAPYHVVPLNDSYSQDTDHARSHLLRAQGVIYGPSIKSRDLLHVLYSTQQPSSPFKEANMREEYTSH